MTPPPQLREGAVAGLGRAPGARSWEQRTRCRPVSATAWEQVSDLGWLQASLPLLAQGCVILFVCSLLGLCPNLLSHVEYCQAPCLWSGKSSPLRLQTQLRNQLEVSSQEAQASAGSAPLPPPSLMQVHPSASRYTAFSWHRFAISQISLSRDGDCPSRGPSVSRLDFCVSFPRVPLSLISFLHLPSEKGIQTQRWPFVPSA